MPELETVKVKSGKGYLIINARDFDPKKHKPFTEDETVKAGPASGAGNKVTGSGDDQGGGEDLSALGRAELIERLEAAGGSLAEVKGTGKKGSVKNEDLFMAITEAEAKRAAQE